MPDLGAPFKVQSEPFALTRAVVAKVATQPAQASGNGNRDRTMRVLVLLVVVVAGVLGFTYRKRPAA
jgi:hypothetical protein